MQPDQRYLHVEKLLDESQLLQIWKLIQSADFQDGTATATDFAKSVKKNQQIRAEDNFQAQQAGNIILQAMSQHPQVQTAIMPKMVLPPLISKYTESMNYGMHVDSPLMGSQYTIRTDVGMTLFLSHPDTYQGGELEVLTEAGEKRFKLPAGDAVIYPTTKLHRVLPVTAGVRMAAVTWMQCAVRNPELRDMLYSFNQATQSVGHKGMKEEHLALQQVYANLVRMWAEI